MTNAGVRRPGDDNQAVSSTEGPGVKISAWGKGVSGKGEKI